MRIAIDVGLLALVGFAVLPACGSHGALPAGGTGGGTTTGAPGGTVTAASGGTVAAASGGTGGAMVRPATGGSGGGSSAGGSGGGSSAGGAGGSTSVQVVGAPCAVEGQQSECATGRPLGSACGSCMGHWLVCQTGRWIEVHCDPPPPEPPLDAAVDGRDASDARDTGDTGDAADLPPLPDANPIDTTAIETGGLDTGSAIDGTGVLRGYLVYANELMAFEVCGTTSLAWANLQGWEAGRELLPALGPFCVATDAGPAPCPGTIYVELAGSIVSDGSYGHMGKFTSQLTVGRYLAASLTGPPDCPFLSPVYPN